MDTDGSKARVIEDLASDPNLTVNQLASAAEKHGIDPIAFLDQAST